MKRYIAVMLSIGAVMTASADVVHEQRFEMDAAGALGMLASGGTVRSFVAGDRSRTETDVQSKSKMMRMFGGGGPAKEITRLDLGLMWRIDPKAKEYTEMSFEQLRAQMADSRARLEEAQQQMREAGGGQGTAGLPVSEQNCDWQGRDIDVRKTGEKMKIAGIEAERGVIRISQTCRDPESGKACEISWLLEQWQAESVPGAEEIQAFGRAYVKAIGMEDMFGDRIHSSGQALMSMFGNGWEEVAKSAAELNGYALKTVMEIQVGGEQCTLDNGQPVVGSDLFANALVDAQNAAVDQAASEAGYAIGQSTAEAMGDSVGGSVGGAAIGALGKSVASGVFAAFKKKPAPEPKPKPASGSGSKAVQLMRMVSETTKISTRDIDDEKFELKDSWKKR